MERIEIKGAIGTLLGAGNTDLPLAAANQNNNIRELQHHYNRQPFKKPHHLRFTPLNVPILLHF